MQVEQWFSLLSSTALLGWLLLAAGSAMPQARARHLLLSAGGRAVPLLLCSAYLALLVRYWGSAPGGDFNSLAGVAKLFASEGKLLGGWVHFLAFDLFIARWMVDDTQAAGHSRWRLLPCLPLTLLYGPAGLLLYFALKALKPATSAVR